MGLIKSSLRRPITIIVFVFGLLFFGVSAVRSIKVDIFPAIDLPVLYISHPYAGFTPDQMEGYFGKSYVGLLLYVTGLKSIETRNIQGLTLLKLTFYPGTNMAQAAAEATAYANRSMALFPPGTQPPFLLRFDASTLPVGQLILSSPKRTTGELQDLGWNYVRAGFSSINGLTAPAPFGGNARTVVIKVDPTKMRAHNMSPDQLVAALRINNQASPGGNVRIGDLSYITPINTTIETVKDFENIPLFTGSVQNLYLKDVATVEDGADVTAGYVSVNGRRSVYLPITKSASASTWQVVKDLKEALPRFEASLPEDVKLDFVFDQSVYVINAVQSLVTEGVIGAILTGLMVLLFLGDPRGALIVVLTIPTSLISGVLFLSLFGQTINIMTLSGLALAIGILVDQATVSIENIHQHLAMGKPKGQAIWDACKEVAFPELLILLCILAVFAPAFTMGGIPGSLFLPLALAIAFSVITSYVLAQTLVPILANWFMKEHKSQHHDLKTNKFDILRSRFMWCIERFLPYKKVVTVTYLVGGLVLTGYLLSIIGTDILPKSNAGQFQVRIRDKDGTRIEQTERDVLAIMEELYKIVGRENVQISSAMVGMHGSLYSTAPIYLFMAGPHEAVLQVALRPGFETDMDELKDEFRRRVKEALPDVKLSFEPIELTEKILSQGSPTPVEVKLIGKNKKLNKEYALKLVSQMQKIPALRDVQISQAINYPAINVEVDRIRASQLGTNMADISRSFTAATSSSRFIEKNMWIDPKLNLSYNVQVQIPENEMTSIEDVGQIPVSPNSLRPVLNDVATIRLDTTYGENATQGALPTLSVTANVFKQDLGSVSKEVESAIKSLGELPRGLTIEMKGLTQVLTETLDRLQGGLIVAIVVIFLMLAANYQSFKVSLVILSTVPAVLIGSLAMLLITNSTLNLQSYMGIIMSVGVSISNAVLMITYAENLRKKNGNALVCAKEAITVRLRPILMTSIAMIAGMIPMASGWGEAGDQTAPLGRAVIGGLVASTIVSLFILPLIFAWVQGKASMQSVSLDPEDKESKNFIPASSERIPNQS